MCLFSIHIRQRGASALALDYMLSAVNLREVAPNTEDNDDDAAFIVQVHNSIPRYSAKATPNIDMEVLLKRLYILYMIHANRRYARAYLLFTY